MRKRISLVLAVLTLVVAMVGTVAFFTDRIEATAQATAGTLVLDLESISASNGENLVPGRGSVITYKLSNTGNKSADVLETMILNVGVVMNDTTPEFKLYPSSAVTFENGTNKVATVDTSEAISFSLSADKKSIIFDLTPDKTVPVILSGVNAGAEIEYNNSTPYAAFKQGEYVLVFGNNAGNTFQDLDLTMYYMAQAKQHRNTSNTADAWTPLQSPITFANGTFQAVPEA